MSDASSSSSSLVERGIDEMMITDPIEIEENKQIRVVPQAERVVGTTGEFAKTSACPTSISTTNPTQVGGPLPTHSATTAVTLGKSTILPIVERKNTKHANKSLSAKNDAASFMASSSLKKEEPATDDSFEPTITTDVQTLTASERIIDNVLGTTTKEKGCSVIEANPTAAAKDEEDRKTSFHTPKNNFSESFPKMSVSTTTTPSSTSQPGESPGKKKPRKSSKHRPKDGQSTGRWTDEEHQAFLRGLHTYGREWKKVASHIPTRTSAQVRSHAQKYFAKLQKEEDSWTGSYAFAEGTMAAGGGGTPNAVPIRDDASGHGGGGGMDRSTATVSTSVQANVERIMANPETVEAEVEDTLRQLRERYEALQRRLEQTSATRADRKRRSPHPLVVDDQSSATSLSASLQNEELIALSVLRGGLPAGDASVGASELSEDNMDTGSHQTESTGSKKAKHD